MYMQVAGKIWEFPDLKRRRESDGTETYSAKDLEKVHLAIANAICDQNEELIPDELEFLCDMSQNKLKECAECLRNSANTVTRWLNPICRIDCSETVVET